MISSSKRFYAPFAADFGCQKLARRHVHNAHARNRVADNRRHKVVVAFSVEHVVFKHGSRRDNPRHLALDQPFGVLGVFHLIHDGDTPPLVDQAGDVTLRRVVRDARHRDADAAILAPGQRDVQVAGNDFRRFAIRFVKVTHAHQQNDAGMLLTGGEILLHQRRTALIIFGNRFGSRALGRRHSGRGINTRRGNIRRRRRSVDGHGSRVI